MSVVLDILRTYRAPREVQRRRLGGGLREDRALVVLMAACIIGFIAQWPRLAREAHVDPTIGFDARLAGALFGWLMVMPLLLYVVSLIVLGVQRLFGRRVTGYATRMSMFWAFLAASPLLLLSGLTAGFVGPGTMLGVVGMLFVIAFVTFWIAGLREIGTSAAETQA